MPSELTTYISSLIGSITSNLPGNLSITAQSSTIILRKQINNITDNFKSNIADVLKNFSSHADYIEDAVNSAEYFA